MLSGDNSNFISALSFILNVALMGIPPASLRPYIIMELSVTISLLSFVSQYGPFP